MAAPAQYPRWSTDGGTTTTPSSGAQDTGFIPGTAAAAKIVNWLINLIYQWIVWLNTQDIANTAAHVNYDAGLVTLTKRAASRDHQVFTQPRDTITAAFGQTHLASGGNAATPLHVVVGTSGNWMRSNDRCRSWTSPATAGSALFNCVMYNPVTSTFVAAGATQTLYESNNTATSWTARTPAGSFTGTFYDIAWFPPAALLVLVGTSGGGAGEIETAPSSTWTQRTCPAAVTDLRALAHDGTTLVAVGAAGSDGAVISSTNGTTWTARATISGSGVLKHIVYHPAHACWYAATDTNIYKSSNLTTWTSWGYVLDSGHVFSGLVSLAQGIVAFHFNNGVGQTGCMAKFSPDGSLWYASLGFGPNGGNPRVCKVYPYAPTATDATKSYAMFCGSVFAGTFSISQWYAPDGYY